MHSAGTNLRLAIAAVCLASVTGTACIEFDRGGPKDAHSITFEVKYADLSSGEAEVSYTDSDGQPVAARVTTPWVSETVAVRSGQTYRLDASTVPRSGSGFYCGVHTDTGWNVGNSESRGECSYSYPDDVGD